MTTPKAQCEAVKSAISGGNATASTVTTLQSLLSAEAKSKPTIKNGETQAEKKTTGRKTPVAKPTGSRTLKKDAAIDVHQDGARSLAPRERYALATEVVNITLKALTESLKSRTKQQPKVTASENSGSSTPATPRKLNRTSSSVSQRVLQPRSGNSTPLTATPTKPKTSPEKPPRGLDAQANGPSPHTLATGECSRLAFSFLRSANTKQLGVRDIPPLQLENGMLALVGKLLAHGLDSLAIKELRIVKGRLEAVGKPKASGPPEKETLAGLLQVNIDTEKQPAVLALAITYQSLVLRVIASSSKPATIEASVEFLDQSNATSPSNMIKLQSDLSGDGAKAGRLLEMLSSSVLGLCPSLSSKADQVAINRELSPAPEAVFQLQKVGFQIRKQWWELVQHQPDLEKELFDPLSRCLSAFIRRTRKRQAAQKTFEAANQCIEDLITGHTSADSKALSAISRTLSSLAEQTGRTEEAEKWSQVLNQQCRSLDKNHAQRIAAVAKNVPTQNPTPAILRELTSGMQQTMSGSTSDYEFLLAELASLLSRLQPSSEVSEDFQTLITLSAAFALRFCRSYPGQGLIAAQNIVHHAIRQSSPTEAPISWINHEAIQILLEAGALGSAMEEAATKPMGRAWKSSTAAATLARALRLLIVRAVKSGTEVTHAAIFDDPKRGSLERGILLEWQLKAAIEYATRSKYHSALRILLPHMLQELQSLYTSTQYPLRRANLATIAIRLCEEHPTLIEPESIRAWIDTQIDSESLSEDHGLRAYTADIDAALKLVKIFHSGQPSIRNLKPLLVTWQRLIDDVSGSAGLESYVFDPAALKSSLQSMASLFGALGEDTDRLSVLALIEKLDSLLEMDDTETVDSSVDSAKQWLLVGYSEKSASILARTEKLLASEDVSTLSRIRWHLTHAEYFLKVDNLDKAQQSLQAAHDLRLSLPPKEVAKDQRASYERAHGEGWLLHSMYCLARGAPHDALAAAKHAMKLVNSTWCRHEKDQSSDATPPEADEAKAEVAELTAGVSKLKLLPKGEEKSVAEASMKGAAFWPLIPLLCRAMMHLSDLYAHHGLFSESSYYSGKAIEIAESVGSSVLLSRTKSHQARLLALAGKVEEAELALVGCESMDLSSSPVAAIEQLQAHAAVRIKDGSPEEAVKLYNEADQLLCKMQSEDFMGQISSFEDQAANKKPVAKSAQPAPPAKTTRAPTRARKTAVKPVSAPAKAPARSAKAKAAPTEKTFYVLQKIRAEILLSKTLLGIDSTDNEEEVLHALTPLKTAVRGTLRQRRVQYRQLMSKATAALQMDFAYNILLDSTLSFPALLRPATTEDAAPSSTVTKKTPPARTTTRGAQRKTSAKPMFQDTLQEAYSCLSAGHSSISRFCTSAEIYSEGGSLLDVSMLCSSVDATAAAKSLNPVQAGLALDFPRINALEFERNAANVDVSHEQKTTPFEWPSTDFNTPSPQLNAATFHDEYIGIIPKPWTAVSLSLDESCNSLCVARYRADHTPFVVRLPFSRHQDAEIGDEAFDYAAGKEELQDIIQLSNTSCHNNGDLSAKGAKSSWWSEREALDRRLQELLINIEDMWFGGFKGIFSPRARQPELLARFRASLEAALDRHLPSRQATKSRAAKLSLDPNVLELFINLGSDNEGTIDLDEPISDLLYFVVDMLQFNGERNAYDEIDFDEMTVEVLDALRSYHEASKAKDNADQHVVLVLDKRLQAFPWENLPCLEQTSVSRVGSMLSLRDCITAMRFQRHAEARHMLSRKSGAYILNPSSDLKSTETTLLPALSKAAEVDGAQWTSIVNRAPSEDDFKSTLQNAGLTLYFGHGAGSQYIRPRTIKKLESCSEVVWLMGCSSGAVTEHGELEPQAVPLAYLNAGKRPISPATGENEVASTNSRCLAVVATLWDVTDKDIDRFSLTVGEEWDLWAPPAEPAKLSAKTPKKRERVVAPSTPQRAPKTPKTPKVAKTPAAAKTPARSRSRSTAKDRNGPVSLSGAVAKSRDACYLRYLNGAAPVVYGVPVYLGD